MRRMGAGSSVDRREADWMTIGAITKKNVLRQYVRISLLNKPKGKKHPRNQPSQDKAKRKYERGFYWEGR